MQQAFVKRSNLPIKKWGSERAGGKRTRTNADGGPTGEGEGETGYGYYRLVDCSTGKDDQTADVGEFSSTRLARLSAVKGPSRLTDFLAS